MSLSTIAFAAHALRPSMTSDNPQNKERSQGSPQAVTGNSYSIFTTKNYGDNEMHWFWMVLICALLLFVWWGHQRRIARRDERPAGTSANSTRSNSK